MGYKSLLPAAHTVTALLFLGHGGGRSGGAMMKIVIIMVKIPMKGGGGYGGFNIRGRRKMLNIRGG